MPPTKKKKNVPRPRKRGGGRKPARTRLVASDPQPPATLREAINVSLRKGGGPLLLLPPPPPTLPPTLLQPL